MLIKEMRLIPMEDEDSPMVINAPIDGRLHIDWVTRFLHTVALQYGPWPNEDTSHMQGILETLAKCFEAAGDEPGVYRGTYREMGGDGNYDIEITFTK